jgi:hypothetical protein
MQQYYKTVHTKKEKMDIWKMNTIKLQVDLSDEK